MTFVGRADFGAQPDAATAAGFKAFAERQGRPVKIATQPPGSVPDTVLRYWLQNVIKADPATYQITAMGIEATQQALLAGAVDAATIREPTLTVVLARDPKSAAGGRRPDAAQSAGFRTGVDRRLREGQSGSCQDGGGSA